MQVCHANVSCHFGAARTLSMLERYYWWVGMSICTKWWIRHCLRCQARKSSRQTARWPILSLPLPSGPGVSVSVDYFGPLPVTPRGNTYILLFTDRFSRRADITLSRQLNLLPKELQTFLSIGTSLYGAAPQVSSPITARSFVQNSLKLYISALVFARWQPVLTIQMETVVLNVLIIRWRKCLLWS